MLILRFAMHRTNPAIVAVTSFFKTSQLRYEAAGPQGPFPSVTDSARLYISCFINKT